MSLALPLSEDQRDCLQELTNIAMGAAGESLADFTNTFVTISIPKIRCVRAETFTECLSQLQGHKQVSAVKQSYTLGSNNCVAMVAISDESFADLSEFTGRCIKGDDVATSLLFDLCDAITQICLTRLADMMELPININPPEVMALHQPLEALNKALPDNLGTISVEINYHLEKHRFNCDLLLLFPKSSMTTVTHSLDQLLA